MDWQQAFQQFRQQYGDEKTVVAFRPSLVDMVGDLNAGLFLSQVCYWYGFDRGVSRLRVFHDGYHWIAKARHEWYDEIRMSPKQVDRAIKYLLDEPEPVIEKKLFRFNGSPTTHIRLIGETFMRRFSETLSTPYVNPYAPTENGFCPNVENEIDESPDDCSEGKVDFAQESKSLTETTTEIKKKHVLRTCLVPRCAAPVPDVQAVEALPEPEYEPIENEFDNRSASERPQEEKVPRKAYMGCPAEEMQRLIDAFTQETEIAPRPCPENVSKTQSRKYFAYLNSEWRTPLAEFWTRCEGNVEETEDLLRQACQRHLDEKLSLKGPKSVEYQFVQLLADQKRAGKVDVSASVSLLEHWMARKSS